MPRITIFIVIVSAFLHIDTMSANDQNQIPISTSRKLSSGFNLTNLFNGISDLNDEGETNSESLGYPDEEASKRNDPVIPQPAICMPELRTMSLRNSDPNRSLVYIPSCTRIEQCGGCCPDEDLQSCQPTVVEPIRFKVRVKKFEGGGRLKPMGTRIVVLERHKNCTCDCIIKASDCNRLQEYSKRTCSCICANTDEKRKCLSSELKTWDQHDCTCQCLKIKDCPTGYFFNKHSCSCEREQVSGARNRTVYPDSLRFA